MKVKIKKLLPRAVMPTKRDGDAGYDLTATNVAHTTDEKASFGYVEYSTDLAIEIPEGYVGYIYPRSSISKTGLILANSVGVIDSSYRGEVKLRFKYISRTELYKVGDRVGQLIIMPLPNIELEEAEELSSTERGEGGFGSTGN